MMSLAPAGHRLGRRAEELRRATSPLRAAVAVGTASLLSGCVVFGGGDTPLEQAATACEERADRDTADGEEDLEDLEDLDEELDDDARDAIDALLNPEFEFMGAIEDDGNSYILSGVPDDSPRSADAYQSMLCIVDEVGASEALINRIGSTRALDGQQSRTEDDIEYTWSYHPDSGISFMAELVGG